MTGDSFDAEGDGFREINVIPLVDVMLVLLIVFMIAAPMMEADLTVDLPDENVATQSDERETTNVVVKADESVFLDEREITGAVGPALAELRTRSKPVDLAIRADRNTRYEAVADVVAAAQANGLRVTLVVNTVGP